MGARPSSSFGYPNNIPNIYNENLAVKYEVLSSILGLQIGQSYNLGITAPISYLQQILPEFTFTQTLYDLWSVRRSTYLGDSNRCCITGEDYFQFQGVWISCPPALRMPGTTRSCDLTLSNYCFGNPSNTEACRAWFEGYIRDRGYDAFTILGYDSCRTEAQIASNKFCDIYLTIMRKNPDTSIHDEFIDSIRDATFRCSYPLRRTQMLANRTNVKRVCWDQACIASPVWKMKSKDYIDRLNCPVSISDVTYQLEYPTTIDYVKVQSDALDIAEFRQVLFDQNIYTQPLKDLGKGFLDIFPLLTILSISIMLAF